MNYTHLTEEERYQIRAMLVAEFSIREIAQRLGRSASTICREIRRNRGQRGYRPKQAQEQAEQRASACRSRCRITPEQWRCVRRLLQRDWSPEQVAERTWLEGTVQVSHEWIYQFVYADQAVGGDLHTHLRCQKQRRKRYGSGRQRRGQIIGRVGIEQRPSAADERVEVGHWEADTHCRQRPARRLPDCGGATISLYPLGQAQSPHGWGNCTSASRSTQAIGACRQNDHL